MNTRAHSDRPLPPPGESGSNPAPAGRRNRRAGWVVGAVAGLLFLFALQAVLSLRVKFTTFDEAFYLAGGHSYLVTGDTRMVNRYHPPLAQCLTAAPLLSLHLNPPERDPAWWLPKSDLTSRAFALRFLYHNRAPWRSILMRGRLMMVALAVVVGLVVVLWAWELGGRGAGLAAGLLYAFSPNLLAHARLATTDFPVAGLSFAACYLLWRFYRRPGPGRLLLAGLVLGLALLSKLSALIFCPVVLLLSLLYVLAPPPTPRRRAGWGARVEARLARSRLARAGLAAAAVVVVAAAACVVIRLGYWGAAGPGTREEFLKQVAAALSGGGAQGPGPLGRMCLAVGRRLPLPKQYWELLAWLLAKSHTGHRAFLAGRLSQTGWWYYFPVVLAIKTPLPTLLLAAMWAVRGWRRENLFDRLSLLLPPAGFLLVSMTSHINIGYRHILPVVPFLLVAAGDAVAREWTGRRLRRARRVLVGLLLVWYAAGTVRVAPHYLAYFNESVGGPAQGYRYLVDSNLDWGQDLLGLRDYLRRRGAREVKLAYFGLVTPEVIRSLGIPYRPVSRRERLEPTPGLYAVSATLLQGAYGTGLFGEARGRPFGWLKRLEPEAVIGYTIFVYRVSEGDAARLKEAAR